jgi:hypothetical protein
MIRRREKFSSRRIITEVRRRGARAYGRSMTNETNRANANNHGDYERRDIGASVIIYFLISLAVFIFITYLVAKGVFYELDRRSQEQQPTVSPLVTNAPTDTRHLPPQYKTDAKSTDYEKYLEKNFPAPQLETDERNQLNSVRLNEEQILSTYGYVDQNAGIVRIPIERAMDLIAQRGLPVRGQSPTSEASATQANAKSKTKGTQQ